MIKTYTFPKESFIILSLCLFLLISCKRDAVETLTTELDVTVNLDQKTVAGAKVQLFRSLTDLETRLRPVATAMTDGSGKARFKNLQSVEYYLFASYNDNEYSYDNSLKAFQLFDDLIDGAITFVKVDIEYSRPLKPTRMIVNSLELIRFDTTQWNSKLSSNCSDTLSFELTATDAEENIDTLSTAKDSVLFCYRQNLPQPASTYFENNFSIDLKKYKYISLNTYLVQPKRQVSSPIDDISRKYNLNISSLPLETITGNEGAGKILYPNRIRVMEGEVKSPPREKYIRTIVDLRVIWE